MNDTGMTDPIEHQTVSILALVESIEKRGEELHAQIAALVKERNALRAALVDLEFLFEDKVDIKDGPEGQQLPNDAMKAMTIIRGVL
jgi:hypothetical protein